MQGLQDVTVVTACAAFTFGMVLALLGSLKLALAKRMNVGEGRIGLLLSALNLALMPMMIVTGLLIDGAVGVRWVILAGSLLTAAAILVLALRPSYVVGVVAILLAGLGSAGLSTGSIVLMEQAFFPNSFPASLLLGNVFFALGALLTPVLVDVLSSVWSFRNVAIVLALCCLLPVFPAMLWDGQQLKVGHHAADATALAGSATVWLAGLVFFFYAPLEAAISIWATTFLTQLGLSERRATWTLASFWLAFLGSRLLTALVIRTLEGWEAYLLVIPSLLVAVVLGNLSGSASRSAARFGLFLVGVLLGPIFPILIGVLFKTLSDEHLEGYGTAYGLVFAVGSLGSLVLAPLMGVVARQRNVQHALRIPMLLAIVMTFAALVFALAGTR